MKKLILLLILCTPSMVSAQCNPAFWWCSEGPQGPQGIPGVDGIDGVDGVNGNDGQDGQNGLDGNNGIDGVDGHDGISGDDGSAGAAGSRGDRGATGLKGDKGDQGIKGDTGDAAYGAVAGAMAIGILEDPYVGGSVLGASVAYFEDASAVAVGYGKSFNESWSAKAAAFVSDYEGDNSVGAAASASYHF